MARKHQYATENWEAAHEAAEVAAGHIEHEWDYDKTYFLAQILDASPYPQVRDKEWMQAFLDEGFATPSYTDWSKPENGYAQAAILAIELLPVDTILMWE